MPTYFCANCGGKIHSQWELTPSPNLLCKKCHTAKYGDKWKTKTTLYARFGGKSKAKCIVPGCPWKVKEGRSNSHGFNLHRIKSGREGGKYTLENCVLVCPHHHKTIEGLSLEEIKELHCTPEQIARMNKYHITNTLLDYEWKDIENELTKLSKTLGVPLRCDLYDIEHAIKEELGLIESNIPTQRCSVCGAQIDQAADTIFGNMPVCEYCATQVCCIEKGI